MLVGHTSWGKRLPGLLLSLQVVASAGCETSTDESGGSSASGASAAAPTEELKARVIAKVGNETITVGDYVAALERMNQFERLRYRTEARRKELLDEIIDAELLAQEALRRGLDRLPETAEHIRQQLRDETLSHLRSQLPDLAQIPAAEVTAYYNEHSGEYTDPERRRIAAIVTRSKADAAAALTKALSASDKQWGELVTQYSMKREPASESKPPRFELDGDLGFVTAPGTPGTDEPAAPDSVRQAAFQLKKPGEVFSSVIVAGDQHYVLRLINVNAPRKRTLEEADGAIRLKLSQLRFDAALKALEQELREKVPVKIDREALAKVTLAAEPSEQSMGAAGASAGAAPTSTAGTSAGGAASAGAASAP